MSSNNPNKIEPEFYIRRIDKMLESGDYEFAREYLTDVREFIEKENRFTPKQVEAIGNIKRSIQ